MVAENLVPGVMRCAKCEFQLVRTNLYVNSGTAGPSDSRTEPCPNGCGPLWPITWKQWAEEAQKTAERFFDEAEAERAKVDELAMLVRRLAHALDKPSGNTLLARQAVDYLRRHSLQGSPLRESPTPETVPAPEASFVETFRRSPRRVQETPADACMAKVRQHFDERRCSCKDFPGADEFCTAHKVETAAALSWRCSICNTVNPDDATHCRQCEYSRMILRDGRDVPRDGYR